MSAQVIELIILFAVAAFVLYRLKTVIGTRTGHEGPPAHLRSREERGPEGVEDAAPAVGAAQAATEAAEAKDLSEESRAALRKIEVSEPGFDLREFTQGAAAAYEMILVAYEEGDRDTLRSLLAPDVFDAFERAIADREAKELTVEAHFIGVKDLKIESIAFDEVSNTADVSLRFTGEMVVAVRDVENRVVEGDPNTPRRQTDLWTFSREMGATDPNWLLSATGD